MRERLDLLLRDLQGAVTARHLYPPDHPRVLETMRRLVEGIGEVTHGGPVAVYGLDHRVVYGGTPLPSGDALWRGLFTWLAARGFHRLTLHPGVTAQELTVFVSSLAELARATDAPVAFASSAHLKLSAVDAGDEDGTPEVSGAGASIPVDTGSSLGRMWRQVIEDRSLDFDALDVTVLALLRTVEQQQRAVLPLATLRQHDDYTVVHIVNVALLAIALAEAVGFRGAHLRDIGVAALLHDIGKLQVPADVLNAPGRLTEAQRALIRRHPEDGARILMVTPGVPELAVSVAFEHHVHYDGGGYPAVPKGWRVNVASEVTHIADVFDALRSHRPYRAGLPHDEVARLMERDAGTVFSPSLLRTFLDVVVPRAVTDATPALAP